MKRLFEGENIFFSLVLTGGCRSSKIETWRVQCHEIKKMRSEKWKHSILGRYNTLFFEKNTTKKRCLLHFYTGPNENDGCPVGSGDLHLGPHANWQGRAKPCDHSTGLSNLPYWPQRVAATPVELHESPCRAWWPPCGVHQPGMANTIFTIIYIAIIDISIFFSLICVIFMLYIYYIYISYARHK